MRLISLLLVITIVLLPAKNKNIKSLFNGTGQTTTKKIKQTKKNLNNTGEEQKQLNAQLSKIAKAIIKAEKENIILAKALKELGKNKEENEQKYQKSKQKINAFQGKIKSLDSTIEEQNTQLREMLINQLSTIVAVNQMEKDTVDSIIKREVYEVYKQYNVHGLNDLKKKINVSKKKKRIVYGYQKKIEKSIKQISKKRELYRKKKKKKAELLKKLSLDEKKYRKSIKELVKRQSLIRSTLAKLNIIRKDEIKEAKARELARQAEVTRRADIRNRARDTQGSEHVVAKSFASNQSVKQYGSSYQKNVYRYRGAKTMSPIKRAKVVKSFGTYIDPIYKMKIFNESVTLKAPTKNAKVRSVLNGVIVFAGENSMLGKMVVIAHGNKLHTIYAGLSAISSTVRTNKRIRKNVIIGKVKSKLIFEATKNSKYINPLRLIRL